MLTTQESQEKLVSSLDLAKELNKTPSNLMRIIKSKKFPYSEEKIIKENGQKVLCRWVTEEIAEQIRNPVRKKRIRWNNKKIDAYLAEHNLPIKRDFKEYTNIDDESLWWQCLNESEHRWQSAWSNIVHAGSGCHECNGYYTYSYDDILKIIEEDHPTKKLLTTREEFEKLPYGSTLRWACTVPNCNYTWGSTWSKINWQGTGCHRCSGNEHWTVEKIKDKLATDPAFSTIEYVSGEYNSNKKSVLTWRCKNKDCGHEWPVAWYNINIKGTRCPDCAKRGVYCFENAERYKEYWEKEHLIVYTLKCWDDKTGELFYKIGVTCHSRAEQRYKTHQALPYKFQVLDEIKTNKYDGSYLEHELQRVVNKQYVYEPKKFFHGHTECFSDVIHLNLDEIDYSKLKIYSRKRKEK